MKKMKRICPILIVLFVCSHSAWASLEKCLKSFYGNYEAPYALMNVRLSSLQEVSQFERVALVAQESSQESSQVKKVCTKEIGQLMVVGQKEKYGIQKEIRCNGNQLVVRYEAKFDEVDNCHSFDRCYGVIKKEVLEKVYTRTKARLDYVGHVERFNDLEASKKKLRHFDEKKIPQGAIFLSKGSLRFENIDSSSYRYVESENEFRAVMASFKERNCPQTDHFDFSLDLPKAQVEHEKKRGLRP